MKYDVFISHAAEDKDDVARPLAQELQRRGLRVWYDETVLTIGDSLRRSIDRGLTDSHFGVVILSRSFLDKEWPNRELDGLVGRDDGRTKVILPVWHGLSRAQVARYSPTLVDKLGVSTSCGITHVADEIMRAIEGGTPAVVVTSSATNAISLIRAMVLTSSGRHELTRCRYEVEKYLSRHPHDVEGKLLLDAILQALRYEEAPKELQATLRLPPTLYRLSPVLLALLLLVASAIGLYYGIFKVLRPSATEVAASLEGDRYSLQLASGDTLRFVLTWTAGNDLDLSVQPPTAPLIWYGTRTPVAGGSLDQDDQNGPGEETITMSSVDAGSYRVVVHNYSGRDPAEYRLSVTVNGELRRTFVGTLASQGQRYTLQVEVRR